MKPWNVPLIDFDSFWTFAARADGDFCFLGRLTIPCTRPNQRFVYYRRREFIDIASRYESGTTKQHLAHPGARHA